MSLTNVKIHNAKPLAKVYRISDGKGLYLQIEPGGSKAWRFRYRYANREKMLSFGAYPEISLGEAREKAFKARKLLEDNIDPSAQKQEEKRTVVFNADNTFGAVALEWHDLNLSKWSKGTAEDIWRRIEMHLLPKFGKRPMCEISALELLDAIRLVEKKGKTETSHRLLQYINKIFRFAILTKRATYNPANDLKEALKPHRAKHYPTILLQDVPKLLDDLERAHTSLQNKLAVKLLLLTFVRTVELRKSEKSFYDLDKCEWRLPAELTKMKSMHVVPLSRQAVEVLKQLEEITGNHKMIFPPQHAQKNMFMSENTINMILKRMGYKGKLVGHGFRALASTSLNEAGFNPDVIERQLDHRERNNVRAAYNHAQYMPQRRELMQAWADMIDDEIMRYRAKRKAA